ncbi:hypothetical protein D3C86_1905440 [compost metagenome]
MRHLDLNLVSIDEIVARDAEAAGRHLLDGTAAKIAVRIRCEAIRMLAAFAGIALAADAVHRNRDRFVRFFGDGAVGHSSRLEALENRFDRLNFFDRNRCASCLEAQQSA